MLLELGERSVLASAYVTNHVRKHHLLRLSALIEL
jgi:hypothetical protein